MTLTVFSLAIQSLTMTISLSKTTHTNLKDGQRNGLTGLKIVTKCLKTYPMVVIDLKLKEEQVSQRPQTLVRFLLWLIGPGTSPT